MGFIDDIFSYNGKYLINNDHFYQFPENDDYKVKNDDNWPKDKENKPLSPKKIWLLMGGINNCEIKTKNISKFSYQITAENQKYGIFISIIINFDNKTLFINNFNIKRENSGLGIGSRMLFRQFLYLKSIGIKKIYGYAAGCPNDDKNNGYYTMARLGYNGYVNEKIADKAKNELKMSFTPKTVQEIILTYNGLTWWKKNGRGFDFWFCLSDDSVCSKQLLNYAVSKNMIAY